MNSLAAQLKQVKLKTPNEPTKDYSSPKLAGMCGFSMKWYVIVTVRTVQWPIWSTTLPLPRSRKAEITSIGWCAGDKIQPLALDVKDSSEALLVDMFQEFDIWGGGTYVVYMASSHMPCKSTRVNCLLRRFCYL